MQRQQDRGALTGVLFVVLVLVAFFAVGGSTPDGKASTHKIVTFYHDHSTQQIVAAGLLVLAAVFEMAFASVLRERLKAVSPPGSPLPGLAFAGGIVSAGGFMTAATIHVALADYADDVAPVAAQAMNAIDSDFFIPFAVGLVVLVLGGSLTALRHGGLPKWMAWFGILLTVLAFTPIGFVSFGLAGLWVIIVSILLFRGGEAAPAAPAPA